MKTVSYSVSMMLLLMAWLWQPLQAQNIAALTDEACDCVDSKIKKYHRLIVQYMYDYVELGEEAAERNLKSRFAGLSASEQQKARADINALDGEMGTIISGCLKKISNLNLSEEQLNELKEELAAYKHCYPLVYYIATNSDNKQEEKDTPSTINPNEDASALAEDICDCAYRKINTLHPIVQEFLIELIDMDDTDHIVANYNRRYDKLSQKEQQQASNDLAYIKSVAFKDYIYQCLSVVNQLNESAYDALLNAMQTEPFCKKMRGAITVIKALHKDD